jgi:phosphate transport system substrate-binding protein
MKVSSLGAVVAAGLAVFGPALAVELDPALPPYKAKPVENATISSVGSDTLGDLMRIWTEGFAKLNPNVKFSVESKGSGTAPAALASGASQLAPMSRLMTTEEFQPLAAKFGAHPIAPVVAVDAIAVYVNKDNPIACLTIEQLDQIFSKTHLYSGGKDVRTWGGVGLTGDWETQPIHLFGRNAQSGTHDVFTAAVLANGEFRDELKEQSGSEDVVKMVAGDKFAIGYSGIGYLTEGVRTVPLAATRADRCHETTPDEVYSGGYPLARYLYIFMNDPKAKPASPAILEFMKYVVSKDGQSGVVAAKFYPIKNEMRLKDLSVLGMGDASN